MKLLPEDINRLWRPRSEKEKSGALIVIEGFDGSGKTTQINLLSETLSNFGYKPLVTKQPSDSYRKNSLVRRYLKNGGEKKEAYLLAKMAAQDRISHVNKTISDSLSKGQVVICDRYVYSSIALFTYRGVDLDTIINLNSGIIRPDISFYLNLGPTALEKRIQKRDGATEKWEEKSLETIKQICSNYKKLSDFFVCIDATSERLSIHSQIMGQIIKNNLGAKFNQSTLNLTNISSLNIPSANNNRSLIQH